jgi:hypothetical protein
MDTWDGGGVRTGEAVRDEHKALMDVATET